MNPTSLRELASSGSGCSSHTEGPRSSAQLHCQLDLKKQEPEEQKVAAEEKRLAAEREEPASTRVGAYFFLLLLSGACHAVGSLGLVFPSAISPSYCVDCVCLLWVCWVDLASKGNKRQGSGQLGR